MGVVSYTSHNVIVVFNVKCAQTTLYDKIGKPWSQGPDTYFRDFDDNFSEGDKLSHHKRKHPNYFSVAFVRNPYSRLVSQYSYAKRHDRGVHFSKYTVDNYVDDVWVAEKDGKPRGMAKLIHLHHFVDVMPDFIGHQERLAADVQEMVKLVNDRNTGFKPVKYVGLRNLNPSIGAGIKYQKFYNDRLIEMVGKIYEKDIKMFNYDFYGIKEE